MSSSESERHEHSFEFVINAYGELIRVHCATCSATWAVHPT